MVFARYILRHVAARRPTPYRKFRLSSICDARKVVHPFRLADIGEGITECEVIKWSVKPSSVIQAFDPLCEVQSDKASVEITSPFEGVVKEILVKEGQIAKVGENLCTIEVDSDIASETIPEDLEPSPKASSTSRADTPLPSAQPERSQLHETKPHRQDHPLDPQNANSSDVGKEDALALPSVRHFAKANRVDITLLVPGSGRGGRVERKDVEDYLARSSSQAPSGTAEVIKPDEDSVVELGRTRHNMWKAMVKSLEIPHFGYSTYLDLTNLHGLLPLLNAHIPSHYLQSPPEPKPLAVNPSAIYPVPSLPDVALSAKYNRLTYLPVILKTLSRAMSEWPLFRSSITPNASSDGKPTLTVRPHADISIALSTPSGLYTPTILNTDTQSIYSLASRIALVSALGRLSPCGLTPAEMPKRGGTITVSNVGAIGNGEFASPILVPGGGVAIVAIGRAKWIKDEEMPEGQQRRLRVGVSWCADHRVVEGAELAAFVECWRSWIEHPERMIADGI